MEKSAEKLSLPLVIEISNQYWPLRNRYFTENSRRVPLATVLVSVPGF